MSPPAVPTQPCRAHKRPQARHPRPSAPAPGPARRGRSGRSGRAVQRLRRSAGAGAAGGVRSCRRCVGPQMEPAPGAAAFTKCCQETGLLMVVKCRQENTALKDCLVGYYSDPSFYEECKAEYLKQREEYRATGIKKKRQKFTPNV
ncbi:COX assembly mitochondrial protein homolog isoform X2 [Taeniopygia guttata]|uniref:COX assembly mitochondrial protein homolog isoform X2 n=1 Tax=Taeniopygia guttata TaxID=59729 RepID=UPI003BB97E04